MIKRAKLENCEIKEKNTITVLGVCLGLPNVWFIILVCVWVDGVGPAGGLGTDDRAVHEWCRETAKVKTHVTS